MNIISIFNHFRFFFGKNKVMTIALGREKDAEYRENLHKIADVSDHYMYNPLLCSMKTTTHI